MIIPRGLSLAIITIAAILVASIEVYHEYGKGEISTSEYEEIAILLKDNHYPSASAIANNEIKTKNKITKKGYKQILDEVSTKSIIQTLASAQAIAPGNICLAKWKGNWREITIMEVTDNYAKYNLGEKYLSYQEWMLKNEIGDCRTKKDNSALETKRVPLKGTERP